MNTTQVTAYRPGICVKNISLLRSLHCKPRVLLKNVEPCCRLQLSIKEKQSFGLKCRPVYQSGKPLHICLAGGKEMMGNNDENSPWKSLQSAVEKFKGQSIEDVLRRQIEKGEYSGDGGSGAKPPGGGGSSGGGSDSSDGSGGSEDESFAGMLEENIQAILAAIGFIFLYIYILTGEEITKTVRDYIKYLFGGSQSVRLRNAMYQWGEIYDMLIPQEVELDKYWLEKAILNTPTWWHDPGVYREVVRNYLKANPDDINDIKEDLDLDSDEDIMQYLEDSDEDEDSDNEDYEYGYEDEDDK
ncbi:hypothetical protein RJT34_07350 [Clitoria ternatea]|uniref:Uncharacterized protein n=1 Tax=Clitoria ternatea TaxID=43366 RepID=A0AAN9K524_CLITE